MHLNVQEYLESDVANYFRFFALEAVISAAKQHTETVLEVGCGDARAHTRFSQYYGIDKNPAMLAQAKAKNVYLRDILEGTKNIPQAPAVISNYMMMELTTQQMRIAFENIYAYLPTNGRVFFSITNPRLDNDPDLPGYTHVFDSTYTYESEDLRYKVLFEEGKDVGIVDFHNPVETYTRILEDTGFKQITRQEIFGNQEKPYALLFSGTKFAATELGNTKVD